MTDLPNTDLFSPQWNTVSGCLACGENESAPRGHLPGQTYRFGGLAIPFPPGGVALARCGACGLLYKEIVPAPAYLGEVFRKLAGKIWAASYDFAAEAKWIRGRFSEESFDLLDIGAGAGGLLKACAAWPGRRSALDVMKHPGLDASLRGEFITGFLDDDALSWSGAAYGAVALFDVLEHLYNPSQAFQKLRALLKPDGLVFLETGDAASRWPARFGPSEWWYAQIFAHHLFWSRESLERVADRHGFDMVEWRQKRHKGRRAVPWRNAISAAPRAALYRLSPRAFAALAALFGKEGAQPIPPWAKDHFRAVLQKRPR